MLVDEQKELMRYLLSTSTNMAAMTYVKTTYYSRFVPTVVAYANSDDLYLERVGSYPNRWSIRTRHIKLSFKIPHTRVSE